VKYVVTLLILLTAGFAYGQPRGGFGIINRANQIQISCSEGEVLKFSSSVWACAADSSGGGSGATLDLADDDSDESSSIGEIATTGDTNNIFTEPSADKLLIDVGQNWPTADTADALSANGANCSAGNAPLGVDEAGVAESCTDFEEETHASEHLENAADELLVEDLGTACTTGQIVSSDGSGGLDCIADNLGDILDVFGCSSGDCSSITMGATDFLDMSGATPSNTAGLKLPDATDCSAATGEGIVCWDSDNNDLYVGDGASNVSFLKSTAVTLDGAYDNGASIDGANSQGNAVVIGDGTDGLRFYVGTGGPVVECFEGASACDQVTTVADTKSFILNLNTTDALTITSAGDVTLGEPLEEVKVKNVPLSMCQVDGTHCTHQTDVAIGDFTFRWAVTCADNDAATITCEVPADPAWDEAELSVRMRGAHSGARDGDVDADVSILCVGDSETLASVSFGTETALDVSNTGYADDDNVTTAITAQSVAGCSEGDTVFIRYQIDATGTTESNPTNLNWRWMDVYFSYDDWSND